MNISKMGRTSYTIVSIVFIGGKWFIYQNLQTKLHPFMKQNICLTRFSGFSRPENLDFFFF